MNILVIAPHPDDEVIGVGGTIAKRVAQGHRVFVCIVTKGYSPLFDEAFIEKGRCECLEADSLLGVNKTFFLDFPSVQLETIPRHLFNKSFIDLFKEVNPEEVYIPHRGDMQLDHQLVSDAAMVAVRPRGDNNIKRIYSYETLSETGWNIPNTVNEFIPTVYEDISDYIELKLNAMNVFKSQLSDFPAARSIDAIEALARYRGATVYKRAAEAFCLIREIK